MPSRDRPLSRIELLQGTLDLIVLQTLRWGPRHGYGISQLIRAGSADVLQVDTGSLYPALHRLERRKFIAAEWQTSENKQRVRIYRLTPRGRKQLEAERTRWAQLSEAIAGLMKPLPEAGREVAMGPGPPGDRPGRGDPGPPGRGGAGARSAGRGSRRSGLRGAAGVRQRHAGQGGDARDVGRRVDRRLRARPATGRAQPAAVARLPGGRGAGTRARSGPLDHDVRGDRRRAAPRSALRERRQDLPAEPAHERPGGQDGATGGAVPTAP